MSTPADVMALMPGFYRGHATATLSRCDVVDDLPQAKRLLQPAAPGTRRLRLDNRDTLATGMPLRIDADDAARAEVIGIQSVDTSLSADQPAWIELDHPLRHLHRRLPAAVTRPSNYSHRRRVERMRPQVRITSSRCVVRMTMPAMMHKPVADNTKKPRRWLRRLARATSVPMSSNKKNKPNAK